MRASAPQCRDQPWVARRQDRRERRMLRCHVTFSNDVLRSRVRQSVARACDVYRRGVCCCCRGRLARAAAADDDVDQTQQTLAVLLSCAVPVRLPAAGRRARSLVGACWHAGARCAACHRLRCTAARALSCTRGGVPAARGAPTRRRCAVHWCAGTAGCLVRLAAEALRTQASCKAKLR